MRSGRKPRVFLVTHHHRNGRLISGLQIYQHTSIYSLYHPNYLYHFKFEMSRRALPSTSKNNASAPTITSVLHRRPTAYDLTSLRLHPNGVCATSTQKQVSKTVRDARGNLIARDAAGKTRVSAFEKRKRGVVRVEEEGEVIDIGLMEEAGEETLKGKGKESEGGEKVVQDYRAKKRVKFEREYDGFLEARTQESGSSSLPVPSSDLLKTIHHFASHYYSKRGELFDGTAQYRELRKEKRRKKMERFKEQAELGSGGGLEDQLKMDLDERDANDEAVDHEESEFSPSSESGSDEDGHSSQFMTEGGKRSPRRDMYRAFDGAALMAIGMILQEHVASLLVGSNIERQPAPEWYRDSSVGEDELRWETEEREDGEETADGEESEGDTEEERDEG